jgi:hypothetical protein
MSGQAGKYARFESERRLLVGRPLEGVAEDRGLEHHRPLHQGHASSAPADGADPRRTTRSSSSVRSTCYPRPTSPGPGDAHQHLPLAVRIRGARAIRRAELHKRRPALEHNDRVFGVGVFDAHPSGLVLTEVGIETTDDMIQSLELPPSVIREVSDDLRFTGGALAGLTADEAAELLRRLATTRQ